MYNYLLEKLRLLGVGGRMKPGKAEHQL